MVEYASAAVLSISILLYVLLVSQFFLRFVDSSRGMETFFLISNSPLYNPLVPDLFSTSLFLHKQLSLCIAHSLQASQILFIPKPNNTPGKEYRTPMQPTKFYLFNGRTGNPPSRRLRRNLFSGTQVVNNNVGLKVIPPIRLGGLEHRPKRFYATSIPGVR